MYKYLIIIYIFLSSAPTYAKKVLIDPGHGGLDCGAKAKIWQNRKLVVICEKEIALEISKRIKHYIEKYSDYSAYLTRVVDKTLSLDKRSKLADYVKADIFISVHLNGAHDPNPTGFETFYLDNHNDKAVRKIEKVENKHVNGEEAIVNKILADLVIERVAPTSKKLGNFVHKEISKSLKRKFKMKDRGLKPGLFYVLALSKRPSILLEAAFLTNANEAKRAKTEVFQESYAKSVAKGVINYLNSMKEPSLF